MRTVICAIQTNSLGTSFAPISPLCPISFAMFYLFIKSLHMFVGLSTLLGMLICSILLLTSDKSAEETQRSKANLQMAKIAKAVLSWWIFPVLAIVTVLGFYMAFTADWFIMRWVDVKIALALVLIGIAHVLWRFSQKWSQTPLICPPRWIAVCIPLIIGCGASMLYLAFAKPF